MATKVPTRKLVSIPFESKKLSPAAYRAHVIGMWTSFLKSIIFNLFVLVVGLALGMGFSILHIEKIFKENYDTSILTKLEHELVEKGLADKEVEKLLLELKDKQIEKIGLHHPKTATSK